MSDDLVKRLRDRSLAWADALDADAADRIEQLEAALNKCVDIVETYRIPVGNSAAGEMACEWTYDALKQIRDDMKDVISAALAGEKKDE
jgi:hypothetical protein